MAKEIKITFYTPRELWVKFWNRFFWPRRKKCVEWLDLLEVNLVREINDKMLIDKYNAGVIGETLVDDLDVEIRTIIKIEIDKLKKVITIPIE